MEDWEIKEAITKRKSLLGRIHNCQRRDHRKRMNYLKGQKRAHDSTFIIFIAFLTACFFIGWVAS